MSRPTPPTVHYVLLMLTVLMALTCFGVAGGLFAGREALCDYFASDVLLEYEGIICDEEPPGLTEGQSNEQVGTGESLPPGGPVVGDIPITGGGTFGVPEITPLDGEPTSVGSSGTTLGEGGGEIETFTVSPTLSGIACVGSQLMISFEFGQNVSGDYSALIGGQPLTRTAVPNQPTRLYFLGLAPAQDIHALIELKTQPDSATVFSESYTVPACRSSGASASSAQPNCPPPEFFDPLMNRCRIIGNEQPNEPPPDDGYTPPDD